MAELAIEKPDKYIILDTDMGVDDAWALFLILRLILNLSNVKLLGITCVHGNTSMEDVIRNTYRALNALNRTDVSELFDSQLIVLDFIAKIDSDLQGSNGGIDQYRFSTGRSTIFWR